VLRAAEAFKLYAGGWTYEQIAARLSCSSRSSAWCAVQRH